MINTGSPQGCVMSAYLFALYTNDCRSSTKCCHVIKYADDTAIIALINDPAKDELLYRRQIADTVQWCRDHNLILNTKKTKELIYDVQRNKPECTPVQVNNESVTQVKTFKYLGVLLSDDMTRCDHVGSITSKEKQTFVLSEEVNSGWS